MDKHEFTLSFSELEMIMNWAKKHNLTKRCSPITITTREKFGDGWGLGPSIYVSSYYVKEELFHICDVDCI